MGTRYEPIGKERFSIEQTSHGELIRIKAARQIFAMLFVSVWLVPWTIGGATAFYALVTQFQAFLVFWLCGWAAGWAFAFGTLVWMIAGSETVSVVGSDIEVAHHALGYSRRWLYHGTQVKNLDIVPQLPMPFQFNWQIPFFKLPRNGSIKFDYGPRTIFIAQNLDEGEARIIVEHLDRKLRALAH